MSGVSTSLRGAAACGILSLLAAGVCAQTLKPQANQGDSEGNHLGVATCASTLCHGSARTLSAHNVLQSEYVTWSHFDPHSHAYAALLEERGRRIAKGLGLKNAAEAPQCLACHSDAVTVEKRGERFQLADGIGCEVCHGAAERWIATHYDTPNVTHSDNVKQGMKPLELPHVRAETCIGCHVGDAKRFASHEMMAAGHPRLAFELDTYTELWRTAGGREHFRRDSAYVARKGSISSVEVWLTGLAVAARRSSELIGHRAEGAHGRFPDFALYNCYSCHRTMRFQAWEAGGDDALPPGTLKLQDGHARALLAVLDTLDPARAAPFRKALNALQAAAGEDSQSLLEANQAVEEALTSVERANVHRNRSRQDLEAALDALVAAARHGTFADYAAAEQAAMGMVLLLNEIGADGQRAHDVEELFGTLQDDAHFDRAKFARALAILGSK